MVRTTRKVSKRVLQMWNDAETVWGKNPALEKFWGELASGKRQFSFIGAEHKRL